MRIISLFIFLTLTGCSSYKSSFSCKPGEGYGCKSITEVNEIISGERQSSKSLNISKAELNPGYEKVGIKDKKTIRIWISPYVDRDDIYHESQYIHKIVVKNNWQDLRGP